MEMASTVSVSLDAEDTDALLREAPKAYHTQIHEVLLTALVLACARWTGQSSDARSTSKGMDAKRFSTTWICRAPLVGSRQSFRSCSMLKIVKDREKP